MSGQIAIISLKRLGIITNLKISFFSSRHESKFRPCLDLEDKASIKTGASPQTT
jgi:hypothetical protein